MIDISNCVQQLETNGFCMLPAFYNEAECDEMRAILQNYWRSQGSPSLSANEFGFTVHPMMPNVPEMAKFLGRPEPVQIMAAALRDDVRLVHLGARISGPQSVARLPWHHHYAWDAKGIEGRKRIERLLCGVYVDGTMPEVGALIVQPRRYDETMQEPLGDNMQECPGEIKVEVPPGTVSIFDTALWHAAQRGTGQGLRHLWGGHYQGWNDARLHPEDNDVDAPQIEAAKADYSVLRGLLERQ